MTGSSTSPRVVGPVQRTFVRQVLLTAARRPGGRYWHTHVLNGQAYRVPTGGYVITGVRMEIDQWLARSDHDSDVFRGRFAGAAPQAAADRAARRIVEDVAGAVQRPVHRADRHPGAVGPPAHDARRGEGEECHARPRGA